MESQSLDSREAENSKTDELLTVSNDHLDDLNRPLFQELSRAGYTFYITTVLCNKSWKISKLKHLNNTYAITCTSSTANQPQLTHELLHVWMETKGFTYYTEISEKLCEDYIKVINCDIFNNKQNFCLELNGNFVEFENRLAHLKMLEQFIILGFNKANFLYSTPNFERLKQSYKFKITVFETSQVHDILLDYWSLGLIKKMETLTIVEVETLENLLKKRSEPWFDFSEMMYESWEEDFRGIDNIGFYKKLVGEYKSLELMLVKVNSKEKPDWEIPFLNN